MRKALFLHRRTYAAAMTLHYTFTSLMTFFASFLLPHTQMKQNLKDYSATGAEFSSQ